MNLISRVTKFLLYIFLSVVLLSLINLYASADAWTASLLIIVAAVVILVCLKGNLGNWKIKDPEKTAAIICIALICISLNSFNNASKVTSEREIENRRIAITAEYDEQRSIILAKVEEYTTLQDYEAAANLFSPYVSVLNEEDKATLKNLSDKVDQVKREQRLTEFKSKRGVLVSDIKKLLKDKNYQEAMNLANPHLDIADAEFKALYDQASNGILKQQEEDREASYTGKWETHSEVSPIDDSQNVSISLWAEDMYLDRFQQVITPVLYIRCKEGKTDAAIDWQTYLGLDTTYVTYRMDKDSAQKVKWGISTNNQITFARSPIGFIQKLMNHEELYVGTIPYGENGVSVRFSLAGLKASIKPVREACGW